MLIQTTKQIRTFLAAGGCVLDEPAAVVLAGMLLDGAPTGVPAKTSVRDMVNQMTAHLQQHHGFKLKQSSGYQAVARAWGYKDWNTLSAKIAGHY